MQLWTDFLLKLEGKLGKSVVEKWVRPLEIARFDARNLYLKGKDSFQIDWFEEHLRPILKKEFLNNNGQSVQVHLELQDAVADTKPVFKLNRLSITPDPLDPFMTFEQFIGSEENQIALDVLQTLTKGTYNPIFLYGPKNSGKTHLLTSTAHWLQSQGKKVFFTKAERFTEHVVQSMRLGLMQEFRKVYREIDALLIDDVHLLAKKNATQEEFFHTFNTLHLENKPIVLTAQCMPSHLSEIEPRLISRFEWGLPLGIKKADTRLVLERKAFLWNFPLSSELLDFIVEQFSSSPMSGLESLMLRAKSPPSIELARHLLKDLIEKEKEKQLTPEKLIKKIAAYHGVRLEDLLGKSQTKEYSQPRQVAMYLCRDILQLPYQKLGDIFKRDHSTVMSGIKQVQKQIDEKKVDLSPILKEIQKQPD